MYVSLNCKLFAIVPFKVIAVGVFARNLGGAKYFLLFVITCRESLEKQIKIKCYYK